MKIPIVRKTVIVRRHKFVRRVDVLRRVARAGSTAAKTDVVKTAFVPAIAVRKIAVMKPGIVIRVACV